ncbi:hypothetical protein [Streptomyces hygroscopicus]|uniref:hypothetical protein n=1 Tax=Streptomyces hygroscopicus TaxID=1912 RepID=UPI000A773EDC|nr:hypothetical protein [Streptomyces hygroscopicus]
MVCALGQRAARRRLLCGGVVHPAKRRAPDVLTGPGLGVEPLPGVLEEVTTSGAWIPLCALIRLQL